MLTVSGSLTSKGRFCDGLSRRDFLRIGGLGMGGAALPQLLQAEQIAGFRNSKKSIIMIYMAGAPPHQDMYDLKMDAPSEVRGEFRPIPTNVDGLEICELLPRMAKIMDKCVPIRSLYGAPNGSHDSFMCYTGKVGSTLNMIGQPAGGWPSIGAVTSKLMGTKAENIPSFVGLAPKAGHPPYGSSGKPGFLGFSNGPFKPSGPGKKDLALDGLSLARLDERRGLLESFDQFRRDADQTGMMEGLDEFHEEAFGLLTSSQLAEALNLENEDPKIRERYGKGDPKNFGDGAPRNLEHFLLARRLVEAGARCVTLNFGRWDFHSNNFAGMRSHAPMFDQGLSALIEDLDDRGMLDDTLVVAWGEFGRTPKINGNAGRDHWPRVGGALLAGGGLRTGQVIGATDRLGGEIADRPVHFGEVFATLYHQLGINANKVTIEDLSGRPHFLVDGYKPMRELV
ncbi:DUF1501 domain-containing protein [Verrucomicrobiales bacterium]|jgi:hypothetical protein|nr:DUF1501 domain-containing protein [Verrucomicrobiales bacterium]MDB2496536.1 DUF1501 domain-containing protein [Verrucomicrobiales bacterium]